MISKPCFCRQRHQLLSFGCRPRHGFFDEHMLAGIQGRFGHFKMESDGRGNHHRIELFVLKQIVEAVGRGQVRIQLPHVPQARFAEVAKHFRWQSDAWRKIANEIGPPIAASDDPYFDWFLISSSYVINDPR